MENLIMPDTPEIANLKAFKVQLVKERREIVRTELDAVKQGGLAHADKFLEIQSHIEAVDRAILDEENSDRVSRRG